MRRTEYKKAKIEITSDGITVWINNENGLIGRFGRAGIDIHRCSIEQSEKGECLYCTHTFTVAKDWDTFVVKMKELYDVVVPWKHKPLRFRRSYRRGKSQVLQP